MAVVGCSIRAQLNKTLMFGLSRVKSKLRDPDNNTPLTALKLENYQSNTKTAAFCKIDRKFSRYMHENIQFSSYLASDVRFV